MTESAPCARLRFAAIKSLPLLAAISTLVVGQTAHAIVYRDDESDATAKGLANQNQFGGAGLVLDQTKSFSGTGTLILPDWVLTAKHVVTDDGGNNQYTTAYYDGIAGTVYNDPNSDTTLIHLSQSVSGPTIAPGFLGNEPGHLVWLVGLGGHGSVSQSANGGANLTYNYTAYAGTNVVREYSNPYLYYDNANTAATSSVYEASTAPGDSGGPMYEQVGNVWYVIAQTNGAGSNGFIHTPTNPQQSFILSTIRNEKGNQAFNFTNAAAPTALTWDADVTTDGLNDGAGTWDVQRTNFYNAATGYNYQWDNTMGNDVVFGSNAGAAAVVTIVPTNLTSGTDIDGTAGPTITANGVTAHSLTFNAATSGNYTIASSDGGILTLATSSVNTGDPVLTANVNATISAPIAGTTATITKAGVGTLVFSGTNTYTGNTLVTGGTLQAKYTASLPGYSTSGKVSAAAGTTIAVNAGGTGEWASTDINTLVNTASFASGSSIGIDTTDGAFTYDQALGSTIGFTKLGTNTLTDSVANTYSGATNVQGGTLKFSSTAGLPGGSAVTVASGGTLELDGYVSGGSQTFANPLNLTGGGASGSRGALSFNNGNIYTMNLTGGIKLGGNTTIGAYGVGETINFNSAITGTGNLSFNDEGGLKNSHTFTANFDSKNTYSGSTTFSSGNGNQAFFKLGVDNALPTTTALTLAPGAGNLTFDTNGHDQTLAGLTLNTAIRLAFHLGTNSDLLTTTALSLGSGDIVNVTAATGFGLGTYSLIDYAGTLTNAALLSSWTTGTVPANYNYQFALGTDTATGDPSVQLLVTVPEPMLGGIALLAPLVLRRRNRNITKA